MFACPMKVLRAFALTPAAMNRLAQVCRPPPGQPAEDGAVVSVDELCLGDRDGGRRAAAGSGPAWLAVRREGPVADGSPLASSALPLYVSCTDSVDQH